MPWFSQYRLEQAKDTAEEVGLLIEHDKCRAAIKRSLKHEPKYYIWGFKILDNGNILYLYPLPGL